MEVIMSSSLNISHFRTSDQQVQTVAEHLHRVSELCGARTAKIGLENIGNVLGVLHDFGKYSSEFQNYIRSITRMVDADSPAADHKSLKGKIDHSTAGAQWIWQNFSRYGFQGRLIGQILAACVASHHGGLLDCLSTDGTNGFARRINKADEKTHLQECLDRADAEIMEIINSSAPDTLVHQCMLKLAEIVAPGEKEHDRLKHFRIGFFTRFLFSCLIDADRIDSADFDNPANSTLRRSAPVKWQTIIDRLERKLDGLQEDRGINKIRRKIADRCLARAADGKGIYTLTVPTGGGKTFSSMRFALHHAKLHSMERIFYIIPYTSIIEQNAMAMREALEREDDSFPWILEHHASLEPDDQSWQGKLYAENWDAPVIFTTMVQFLETVFSGGTRAVRRLHSLANSVIIFDEIQTLPVNCVHLFCNALQFIIRYAGSSAVLCTATQPLLGEVDPAKGRLDLSEHNEIVHDVDRLFAELQRVRIRDFLRSRGWQEDEIAEFVLDRFREKGSCLVIVNTKGWARKLYTLCASELDNEIIFHLSTNMCPSHRKKVLGRILRRLEDNQPVLCISTQLIEAGVDVDFNCVIRFLAGLDSIAQAAGRCNRNGKQEMAEVYIVNPCDEPIGSLADIRVGREQAWRIFSERQYDDLLHPEALRQYFAYYFFERGDIMDYPVTGEQVGRSGDSLLNLLADNPLNPGRVQNPGTAMFNLQQSFKTAGKIFQAIDAPTHAVIVPHGEGREIIADLCAAFEPSSAFHLLRRAQRYSVSVFPNIWRKLIDLGAVIPVRMDVDIYYLDEKYYSEEFGLSTEPSNDMAINIV